MAKKTALRPALTHAGKPATFEVEAVNERGEMVPTSVAGEHPLTLYLDKKELVTLMTLGHAPEALAIGYLRNQRLVSSIEDIASVQVDWETDSCAITTRKGVKDLQKKMGKRTVTSGCGQARMRSSGSTGIRVGKLAGPPFTLPKNGASARSEDRSPGFHSLRSPHSTVGIGSASCSVARMAADCRFLQRGRGYLATLVGGTVTRRNDEATGARPGRLVRSAA